MSPIGCWQTVIIGSGPFSGKYWSEGQSFRALLRLSEGFNGTLLYLTLLSKPQVLHKLKLLPETFVAWSLKGGLWIVF